MLIGRKRICLGTYAVVDFGCKVTYSSPLTRKIASNRLYFNNFKDRSVHFYGTVVNFAIKNGTLVSLILAVQSYCTFSFVVEFISFPILCILAAVPAFAQIDNNKYGSVSKVIDKLIFAVGFVVMTYSLYKALIDIDALISNHFIQSFVFP